MVLNKIKTLLTHPNLKYVTTSFLNESVKHPYMISRETMKFFSHWLAGKTEEPKAGLRFEQHCHSHFSDGAELADIVNLLLDNNTKLWSLTDHNNCNAFDALSTGKYDLNKETNTKRKFEVQTNPDKRSLVINCGDKQLVLLRSVEYYADKGEINIHGYAGQVPKKGIAFEDAIKIGVDNGAWVSINHPYFWQGIGYSGRSNIERAVKAGAKAIEKNSTEVPPQIFGVVKAEIDAREFDLALLASGDAHKLHMYGMSGLTFDEQLYVQQLKINQENQADAIKFLVENKQFSTHLNYLTPKQFLDFFKF